jgi:hypothetical protein
MQGSRPATTSNHHHTMLDETWVWDDLLILQVLKCCGMGTEPSEVVLV